MKRFTRNQMDKTDAFVPRKRFMWDKADTIKKYPEFPLGQVAQSQQWSALEDSVTRWRGPRSVMA